MEALLALPITESTIDHSSERGMGDHIGQQIESLPRMQHPLIEEFDTKTQAKIENLQQELIQLQAEVQQKEDEKEKNFQTSYLEGAEEENLEENEELAKKRENITWLESLIAKLQDEEFWKEEKEPFFLRWYRQKILLPMLVDFQNEIVPFLTGKEQTGVTLPQQDVQIVYPTDAATAILA